MYLVDLPTSVLNRGVSEEMGKAAVGIEKGSFALLEEHELSFPLQHSFPQAQGHNYCYSHEKVAGEPRGDENPLLIGRIDTIEVCLYTAFTRMFFPKVRKRENGFNLHYT
jgi:hypothetical protein